ncbi:hypothetical protein EVAR_89609_1 [Eumeta japonica]|uniref:Uncharacterized protein n=1 Tax=Eumeta variegata TaxID=151549 RepID=A0A4C1XNC9_EUMVA|nr:hypothetical protein EVAR_89609_1 [Eumeta japonica]
MLFSDIDSGPYRNGHRYLVPFVRRLSATFMVAGCRGSPLRGFVSWGPFLTAQLYPLGGRRLAEFSEERGVGHSATSRALAQYT